MEQRYRVNLDCRDLKRPEVVMIDDDDPAWAPYIERGFLSRYADDDTPFDDVMSAP